MFDKARKKFLKKRNVCNKRRNKSRTEKQKDISYEKATELDSEIRVAVEYRHAAQYRITKCENIFSFWRLSCFAFARRFHTTYIGHTTFAIPIVLQRLHRKCSRLPWAARICKLTSFQLQNPLLLQLCPVSAALFPPPQTCRDFIHQRRTVIARVIPITARVSAGRNFKTSQRLVS